MAAKKLAQIVYVYNSDGYFLGADSDYGADVPHNATYKKPPSQTGMVARFDSKKKDWSLVEDHRGKNGYVDEKYVEIKSPGPLPVGFSHEKPKLVYSIDEKRQLAYGTEKNDEGLTVDELQEKLNHYRNELEACEAVGDEEGKESMAEKYDAALKSLYELKNKIRKEIPDA